MSFTFVNDPAAAEPVRQRLADADRIALDLEAAGFHRYSDRLCLVQLSFEDRTFILDPFAFDVGEVLRGPLEDPDVRVLMHGSDFDLRLLDRDLDIRLKGLFDTQAAAALLGERALGLSSLLENILDVKLSKKYQRADWARRPLPEDMLEYAAADTRYLHDLVDHLTERLEAAGRRDWAEEEFRELEEIRWEEPEDEDPVTRVKGARDLSAREVTKLREALDWRDRIARERDRAAFRVVGDGALVEVAREHPRSVDELARVKGMNGSLAREEGGELLARLDRVDSLAGEHLVPHPPPDRSGPGRPPPEVEERQRELKKVRNRRAEELGIDRGTLLPNATLMEIALHEPETSDELRSVPGVKEWQVEALGQGLLARLG